MKRFLYKPILQSIDAREKIIAAKISDAEAKKIEAKQELDKFLFKNNEFDKQNSELLKKAQEEAKDERQRILDEARKDSENLRMQRWNALQREQMLLNEAISRKTREEVFLVSRKVLKDLSGTNLQERMNDAFIRKLRDLDGEMKEELTKILTKSPESSVVSSAFELSEKQCNAIKQTLNEMFSDKIHVRFETKPELICGISLTSNGQKMAWSIADYLISLEMNVNELLIEQSRHETNLNKKTIEQNE
jgi:F-type H+-transporting ATPase subunit b